jgi:arginyl-tRNA synthetase
MLEKLRNDLEGALRAAARDAFSTELPRVVLERPPRVALGDLACPAAFDLARTLRKAPRAIAGELAAALRLPAASGSRASREAGT